MTRTTTIARPKAPKASSLDPLIERLNSFSADNYWDLGKFLVDRLIPAALTEGIFGDQILKKLADAPGFKFPYAMLKQCMMFYTYYPDAQKRRLPEIFYFELATKLDESRKRDQYERMAITNKWTISDLQKKIREDEIARREDERTKFGFDLKERNVWTFDVPDPRFGKAGHRGRLAGQIVANAMFYYTHPGAVVVDPMAGSGTTGDIAENLQYFQDRTVRMFDLDPSDQRIQRANILLTGIPEPSGSADYVFLDPPSEFFPHGEDSSFSPDIAKAETMMKLKTILRESTRILKPGGRLSIIVEASTGPFGTIDFPYEVSTVARENGLKQIGKVYLPRRSDSAKRATVSTDGLKPMSSDCRELLTYERP